MITDSDVYQAARIMEELTDEPGAASAHIAIVLIGSLLIRKGVITREDVDELAKAASAICSRATNILLKEED